MEQRLFMRLFWITILLSSQAGCFVGVHCAGSNSPVPAVEVEALVEFKTRYLSQASQLVLHTWNIGAGNISRVCSSWLGVACTPSGHHIQALNLSFLGLEGSLAPHLGNLTFLSYLNLSHNFLTGSLPTQLMGCASLQVVSLSSNRLSGIGSLSLGSFPFLQVMGLGNNSLVGNIPSTLFRNISTSLQRLGLNDNLFSGSIPADLCLQLPSLQALYLENNSLTGAIPSSLGNCTNLLYLYLESNSLTGSIPTELGMIPNLVILYLQGNKLTGTIPAGITNITSLEYVALGSNNLSGVLPMKLGRLHNLKGLGLNDNLLTGSIPADLCLQLPNLQALYLENNSLTGGIPSSLGNCTNLIYLCLDYNSLTGSIPVKLGMMPNLESLYLHWNKLTGTIPPDIGNCSGLEYVALDYNNLSGVLPMELGRLHNLKELHASLNNLTGSIPSSLGNCTSLTHMNLGVNQLSGAIPAQFSTLYRLQLLYLSYNCLSGTPLQHLGFSNLTALLWFDSANNNFSGSISSAALSGLGQLQALDLSNNHFTGHIPWNSITNSTSRLYRLLLSDNELSGPGIPSSLAKLQELRLLYLDSNFLEGQLPESANFSNLHLFQLNLSFNHFTGSLPSSIAPALVTLDFLDFSNNNFTGPVPPWLNGIIEVTVINLSNNGFTGSIPDLGDCAGLTSLNLSRNHLSGNVPLQLGNVAYLEVLDLSHNNLSGELPSFIGTRLRHLQLLDVSFNNFTGPIPTSGGVFQNLTASSFQGNPGLCGPVLKKECIVPPQQEDDQHLQLSSWRGRALVIGALVFFLIFMSVLLHVVLVACRRYGLLKCNKQMVPTSNLAEPKWFTAKELLEATQGYSDDNLLGQGGLSAVYRGVLANGSIVAVKRLKDIYDNTQEALLREMQILGKLRHRNIVQVLGCVLNLDLKALVLEYMENGSLEEHLNSASRSAPSHERTETIRPSYWDVVSRVAIGIAQALAYLHYEYGESIIHGDVKPSNILFDLEFVPHLADFGLAKLIMKEAESVSVTSSYLKGSIGYMAPEYAYATRVTTKVDVYSYGIVLLQMVTGKSPVEMAGTSGITLHEWAKSKLATVAEEGHDGAKWEEVLHSALFQVQEGLPSGASSGNLHLWAVKGLLHTGVACSAHNPNDRPTMNEVLAYLTDRLETASVLARSSKRTLML